MDLQLFFIKKQFYIDNKGFINMLDPGNPEKQSHRAYICVKVTIDNNDYYIPLRNNLGDDVRKFGRIGHYVPTQKRPKAGLDYRYALIILDKNYLEPKKERVIPRKQYEKIINDYKSICQEFETYLMGFKKAIKKNRENKEPLYRVSALVNYREILK